MIGTTTSISDLVNASLRTRAMLLLALTTMVLMVVFSLWALNGLIRQADIDIRLQFQHLTSDLVEQERFLSSLVKASGGQAGLPQESIPSHAISYIGRREKVEYYLVRTVHMGFPFGIRITADSPGVTERLINTVAPLGMIVVRHHIYARGGQENPGTQAFLVALDSPIDLSIPCPSPTDAASFEERCSDVLDGVRRELIKAHAAESADSSLHWMRLDTARSEGSSAGVLLYRHLWVGNAPWLRDLPARQLIAGTYLKMTPAHATLVNPEHMVLRTLDKRSSMERMNGKRQSTPLAVESTYTFRLDGLYIHVLSPSGWDGCYSISWADFVHAARWHVALFLILMTLCLIGSLILYKRHRSMVVLPAQAAHELISESEFFSRAVIDISKVAVVGLRIDNGEIVVRNALADQWLGDEPSMQHLLHGYVARMEEGNAGFLDDTRLLIAGERHLSATYGRTRHHGMNLLLVAFSDVTGSEQAKAAMVAAKQAADEANASKTVFLATMSHEIRTPLYGILGTIELLGLTSLTAQQRGNLDTIQTSSAGLLNIISDILDVSKIESRQMSLKEVEFDPVQLTEEVVQTYAATADAKGLLLYAVICVDVPRQVKGDALRIKQVLNNLLSNAIKFSDAGWVRIALGGESTDGSWWTLSWKVSDTGIGMSDAQAHLLFQPFYQVQGGKQSRPGTGLGLYICYNLCEMMKGSIQVETSPELGSTFSVRLPMPALSASEQEIAPTVLGDDTIWVRAPIGELAQNVSAWLKLAGAKVRTLGDVLPDSGERVLVELFPERMPPVGWDGPRVSCSPSGPEFPQWGVSGVHVNANILRSIVLAVALAQDAGEGHGDRPNSSTAGPLDLRYPTAPPPAGPDHADPYPPLTGLDPLGLRVLVAEDNVVNRALLVKQLEVLGCSVAACADGLDVLDRWRAGGFDVLLTDMNMPNMDGYELVRTLRARGTTHPIIGITASVTPSERELGVALGLDAWLYKPIDLSTLYDCLRRACTGEFETVSRIPDGQLARPSGVDFTEHLKTLFTQSMHADIPQAWGALSQQDPDTLILILHRMRGALAVMKMDQMALFSEVLEARISAEGLTPALTNAVRSMLGELESVIDIFQ